MALTLILALQAAAPVRPPADPPPLIAIDFDLARMPPPAVVQGCGGADGADVLVCGRRRGGTYPMAYWTRIFGPPPPIRAEIGLGGGTTGRLHAEAVPLDRGAVSNRFMVGIRTKF